jgi:putative flippase GtrA
LPRPNRFAEIVRSKEFRFLLIGGFNTLLSLLIFAGLAVWLENSWNKYAIITLSSAISICVNFTSQRIVVWRSRGAIVGEFARYLVSSLVIYLFSLLLFTALHQWAGISFIPAQCIGMLLSTVATYFALKHFAFANREKTA